MILNSILCEQTPGGTGYESILMIVVLFAIFYFFMIRPQSKKQKKIKEFRDKVAAGDKIITAGGIYGKVKEVKDTTFVIEISNQVYILIDKNSVYPSAEDAQSDPANAEKKA